MMSTSKKTRHKILSHKIIVSRFNAKQIHVFYIYFLNRNPDFLIAFYTSFCRLHEQLYSSWWGLVLLRQKRRYMRRIKREMVIIGVECSCIYYGCVYSKCSLSMLFQNLWFSMCSKGIIEGNIILVYWYLYDVWPYNTWPCTWCTTLYVLIYCWSLTQAINNWRKFTSFEMRLRTPFLWIDRVEVKNVHTHLTWLISNWHETVIEFDDQITIQV